MNIVMKMMKLMKIKTLDEQYNDLSELCNHVSFTGDFDECVIDACSFYSQVLIDKEEIYVRLRRRNMIKKVLTSIQGFLKVMIPKDEFKGRYKQ